MNIRGTAPVSRVFWPLSHLFTVDTDVLFLFSSGMVETIGEAWRFGWRITARCAFGNRDGMKSIRPCSYSYELDVRTLIWTRGAPFPLSDLGARLKCPRCGSRRVALIFHAPREPQSQRAAARR